MSSRFPWRAIVIYLWSFALSRGELHQTERIRLDLGRGLVLGLEFLIGADIIRTIVAPSWQDLLILGAIIAIRTVLSFSIGFELARLQSLGGEDEQAGGR